MKNKSTPPKKAAKKKAAKKKSGANPFGKDHRPRGKSNLDDPDYNLPNDRFGDYGEPWEY